MDAGRTYFSTDQNYFLMDATRPQGNFQKKKLDQWSRRRCDNEIVTVLSKGQFAILKMIAIRPY